LYVANSFSFLTSGGVTGLAAVVVGCALLVSGGFHDEWRKLDRIQAALSSSADPGRPAPAGPSCWLRAEADRTAGWALVAVAVIGALLVAGGLVLTMAVRRGRLLHHARRVLRRAAPASAPNRLGEPHRNGADSTRWTAEGLERFHLSACPVLAGIDSTRRTA